VGFVGVLCRRLFNTNLFCCILYGNKSQDKEKDMALFLEYIQDPDGTWRAIAPSMPEARGLGNTQEEARDNARQRAAEWLTENATLTEKPGWFFLHCELLDVSNQGETLQEAKEGMIETLFLYLSDD
jgi:predicted RNase H-like HicB family nuclease